MGPKKQADHSLPLNHNNLALPTGSPWFGSTILADILAVFSGPLTISSFLVIKKSLPTSN